MSDWYQIIALELFVHRSIEASKVKQASMISPSGGGITHRSLTDHTGILFCSHTYFGIQRDKLDGKWTENNDHGKEEDERLKKAKRRGSEFL